MRQGWIGVGVVVLLLSSFHAPAEVPTWVDPVEAYASLEGERRTEAIALREATMGALLTWSRSVRSCSYRYSMGAARPLDARGGLAGWRPEQGLDRTIWSGTTGFDDSGAWWRELWRDPAEHPEGTSRDLLHSAEFSDGTILVGYTNSDGSQLIKPDERRRKSDPDLCKALGHDQSEWSVTPLFELCKYHETGFLAVDTGEGIVRLHGRVPHRDPKVVPGGAAHPVTIEFDRAMKVPISVTWHQPDGLFPTESYDLSHWETIGGTTLPRVIARQTYRPIDIGAYRAWRREQAAGQLRDVGMPDDVDWNDPFWQARAWRVTRARYGDLGVPVEPVTAKGGQYQPIITLVHEFLSINGPNDVRQPPACPLDRSVVNAMTKGVKHRAAHGFVDVTVDRAMVGPGGVPAPRPPAPAASLATPEFVEVVTMTPADLGVLEPSQEAARSVEFRNVGDAAVICTIGSKSCGCVHAELTRDVIEPGETCTLSCSTPVLATVDPQYQRVVVRFVAEGGPPADVPVDFAWRTELANREVTPRVIRRRVIAGVPERYEAFVRSDGAPVMEVLADVVSTVEEVEVLEIQPLSDHTARIVLELKAPPGAPVRGSLVAQWSDRRPDTTALVEVDRIAGAYTTPAGVSLSPGQVIGPTIFRIASRSGHAMPTSARLRGAPDGVRLDTKRISSGLIELAPMECPLSPGGFTVELLDVRGGVVATIPVSWL